MFGLISFNYSARQKDVDKIKDVEKIVEYPRAAIIGDVAFTAIALAGVALAFLIVSQMNLGPLNSISNYLGTTGNTILIGSALGLLSLQVITFAVSSYQRINLCEETKNQIEEDEKKQLEERVSIIEKAKAEEILQLKQQLEELTLEKQKTKETENQREADEKQNIEKRLLAVETTQSGKIRQLEQEIEGLRKQKETTESQLQEANQAFTDGRHYVPTTIIIGGPSEENMPKTLRIGNNEDLSKSNLSRSKMPNDQNLLDVSRMIGAKFGTLNYGEPEDEELQKRIAKNVMLGMPMAMSVLGQALQERTGDEETTEEDIDMAEKVIEWVDMQEQISEELHQQFDQALKAGPPPLKASISKMKIDLQDLIAKKRASLKSTSPAQPSENKAKEIPLYEATKTFYELAQKKASEESEEEEYDSEWDKETTESLYESKRRLPLVKPQSSPEKPEQPQEHKKKIPILTPGEFVDKATQAAMRNEDFIDLCMGLEKRRPAVEDSALEQSTLEQSHF